MKLLAAICTMFQKLRGTPPPPKYFSESNYSSQLKIGRWIRKPKDKITMALFNIYLYSRISSMYFKQILINITTLVYIFIPMTSTHHIKYFTRACAGIHLVSTVLSKSPVILFYGRMITIKIIISCVYTVF